MKFEMKNEFDLYCDGNPLGNLLEEAGKNNDEYYSHIVVRLINAHLAAHPLPTFKPCIEVTGDVFATNFCLHVPHVPNLVVFTILNCVSSTDLKRWIRTALPGALIEPKRERTQAENDANAALAEYFQDGGESSDLASLVAACRAAKAAAESKSQAKEQPCTSTTAGTSQDSTSQPPSSS